MLILLLPQRRCKAVNVESIAPMCPGEGDSGRRPRGDRDPAEHRRRRRHRPHGAGWPAEDPQPEVPGAPGALKDGTDQGGEPSVRRNTNTTQRHGEVGVQKCKTVMRTLAVLSHTHTHTHTNVGRHVGNFVFMTLLSSKTTHTASRLDPTGCSLQRPSADYVRGVGGIMFWHFISQTNKHSSPALCKWVSLCVVFFPKPHHH